MDRFSTPRSFGGEPLRFGLSAYLEYSGMALSNASARSGDPRAMAASEAGIQVSTWRRLLACVLAALHDKRMRGTERVGGK